MSKYLPAAVFFGGGTAALGFLRLVNPYAPNSRLPPCPWLHFTGLYCPGCGSTRTLHALSHGDLERAMQMNPLLVISIPVVAVMVMHIAGWLPARIRPYSAQLFRPVAWGVLLLAYWVLRNLPWAPFSWLAPG